MITFTFVGHYIIEAEFSIHDYYILFFMIFMC